MTRNDTNKPADTPRYVERVPAGQKIPAPKRAENAAGSPSAEQAAETAGDAGKQKELGGPKGPEPTRFGDWERDGRCVDF